MIEALSSREEDIKNSDVLDRLDLFKDQFFVVSSHRDEI